MAHRLGITSIHDVVPIPAWTAYQRLHRAGRLKLRVSAWVPAAAAESLARSGIQSGLGDEWLRMGGVKVFSDGSLGASTAFLDSPYEGRGKDRGMLIHPPTELRSILETAHRAGLRTATHAIGDAASRLVAETLADVQEENPREPMRHRVEHYELPDEETFRLTKDAGLIASCQPNFIGQWSGPGDVYETRLGMDRLRRNNPFRRIAGLDIPLCFGSDGMPYGPLYGIHWAVNGYFEDQRLSPEDAFRAYSASGAYASFGEDRKGTFEAGELSDHVRVQREDVGRILPIQQRDVVYVEHPDDLFDRRRVVVHTDVDPSIIESPVSAAVAHDQERGRLLPTFVAPGPLARGESREQPDRKVALRPLECPAHLLDHVGAGEQISLAGVMLADDMARPVEAFLPGVGGGPTASVDEAHLAPGGLFVGFHEALQDILRRDALFHHAEGLRPEGRVRVGLGRDRADPRLRERHHRADRDEFRFDRDPEVFRLRIESDDAEGRRHRRAHRARHRKEAISRFPQSLRAPLRLRRDGDARLAGPLRRPPGARENVPRIPGPPRRAAGGALRRRGGGVATGP